MTCHPINLNGIRGIVCIRGGRKSAFAKCVKCDQRTADRLCDFPLGNGRTCDKAVCSSCTSSPAPEIDYCPQHAGVEQQQALEL